MPELVDALHGPLHCMRHVGADALDGDDPRADRARVAVLHDQESHGLLLRLAPDEGVVEADLRHSSGLPRHSEVRGVVSAPRDAHFAPDAKRQVRRLMGLHFRARGRSRVASLLRSPGFFCRVLVALLVLGLLLSHPLLLNSIGNGSYRAQSGAGQRVAAQPRVVAHFPCLGKPEATPIPMFMSRRYTPPRLTRSIVRPLATWTI